MSAVQQESSTPLNDALQSAIDDAYTAGISPDDAVAHIVAEYGEEWIAAAVAENALYYARLDVGQRYRFMANIRGDNVSRLRVADPVVTARTSGTSLADRMIWVGTETKPLGQCTADDLLVRATYYRGRASTELRRAAGLEQVAERMRAAGKRTVRGLRLTDEALRELLENLS